MYQIITISKENIDKYPKCICFINPKNEYYHIKKDWILKQLGNGLIIKLMIDKETSKTIGFIEYIDGKNAWRAVKADNYIFIHCIWVYPNNVKNKGYGKILIDEALKDAKNNGNLGVAVITGDGSFIAESKIFEKYGFEKIQVLDSYQLYVKKFSNNSESPIFNDIYKNRNNYSGWNIVYSKQCPWVARFVEEVKVDMNNYGIDIKIVELTSPKEAQNAPTVYSVFSLIKDGKILAEGYISKTRLKNIISKTIK